MPGFWRLLTAAVVLGIFSIAHSIGQFALVFRLRVHQFLETKPVAVVIFFCFGSVSEVSVQHGGLSVDTNLRRPCRASGGECC